MVTHSWRLWNSWWGTILVTIHTCTSWTATKDLINLSESKEKHPIAVNFTVWPQLKAASWLLESLQQVYLLTSLTFVAGLGVFLVSSDWFIWFVMFKLLEKTLYSLLISQMFVWITLHSCHIHVTIFILYIYHMASAFLAVPDQKKLQNNLLATSKSESFY